MVCVRYKPYLQQHFSERFYLGDSVKSAVALEKLDDVTLNRKCEFFFID